MIRLEGVGKRYPDGTVAVDDLSLEAPRGRITVLVGPSGCGKTTTLRMINRMVEPTSGRILLDGEDTAGMDAARLRRSIGYVIQHAGLFPHRTVLGNVMTVPRLHGWSRARARERAKEVLELVGLEPAHARRYPSQLSGGQQQRVGVARALAADPDVLLMDEPFSAVDPVVRGGLQEEFLALQQRLGTTIVLVTHDIDEAIKLGHRIAVLRVGGTLAQFSSPADLLAHPADDFVADFAGADRGYRALSFQHAQVPVHAEEPLRQRASSPGSGRAGGADEPVTPPHGPGETWRLVVDQSGRPLGWRHADDPEGVLRLGGTLARQDGTLRSMLDAALSAPSGRGVVVDGDGVLVGTVRADEVLRAIEEAPRPTGETVRTAEGAG